LNNLEAQEIGKQETSFDRESPNHSETSLELVQELEKLWSKVKALISEYQAKQK
jgi:hypothetical protein